MFFEVSAIRTMIILPCCNFSNSDGKLIVVGNIVYFNLLYNLCQMIVLQYL